MIKTIEEIQAILERNKVKQQEQFVTPIINKEQQDNPVEDKNKRVNKTFKKKQGKKFNYKEYQKRYRNDWDNKMKMREYKRKYYLWKKQLKEQEEASDTIT